MVVLVVDDQPDVVSGILSGVNWKRLRVEKPLGAQSGEEARAILTREQVDILLCDIEMPAESGLELFAWVQEHKSEVKCIFLTAHADFSYAQQALKLGAADYLLQPASYSSIEAAIFRVAEGLREERMFRSYCSLGQDARKEELSFRRNILREFLQGIQASPETAAEKAAAFGFACRPETRCRLVWVQIQAWNGEAWEYGLLLYALENVLSELLEDSAEQVTVFHAGGDSYPVVTAAKPGTGFAAFREGISRFAEYCRSLFGMVVSCYVEPEPRLFRELPEAYRRLREADRNNVTKSGGVLSAGVETLDADYTPDFAKWRALLEEGCGSAVREEIRDYLEGLAGKGALNRKLLARFHEDFLQMFFGVMEGSQGRAYEAFSEIYDYDEVIQASASLPKLLEFVEFATQYIEEKQDPHQSGRAQIDRVMDFIRRNLQKNIGRQEIARAVYLNPEYLSRLFKREMGIGLSEYLVQERMKIAESLLLNTNFSISIVASKVGYVNFSHFAKAFKKEFGVSPSEYRKQHEREG